MELQGRAGELQKLGISLAAVSYDPVETLAAFASAKGITFPLLSDQGSAVIARYGLLNETVEKGTRGYGVPWPGTFILDPGRRVTSRHFEERYQERSTVASILARTGRNLGNAQWRAANAQLSVTGSASDELVAPGSRLTLAFDVTPGRGMHVYAPGADYQVVNIELDPHPLLTAHETVYPASEIYHFVPLDEKVPVYQKPFRLTRDVTVAATREAQQALREAGSLTLAGRLAYQACDDKLCFPPTSLPFSLTLKVKALERP